MPGGSPHGALPAPDLAGSRLRSRALLPTLRVLLPCCMHAAVEADMPMWVVTEDLNDSRKAMQSLKAIMMGPFVMAGVLLCGVAAGRWLAWGGV